MAEIKSTLELALERTRRVSISQEEKEEIKRKETVQKATGIFHRYMEDTLSLNELLREIERIEEKARPMVRDPLLSQWIDAISLEAENEKLLRGIARQVFEWQYCDRLDRVSGRFHPVIKKRKERHNHHQPGSGGE